MSHVRIKLRDSDTVIADGPVGWGITPFEGNFYISSRYLVTDNFHVNYIPGLCIYKFLYVWLDYKIDEDRSISSLGWKYWLPNPLLPFIWFRVAVSKSHEALSFEYY